MRPALLQLIVQVPVSKHDQTNLKDNSVLAAPADGL